MTTDDGKWVFVPDRAVKHIWLNDDQESDDQGEVTVYPDFYQENGQPAYPETGEVLEYLRTEIDLLQVPLVNELRQLLSDDRYPDSKDWASGGLVERVDWLVTMYESKKKELDDYLNRSVNDGSRPSTAEDPNIDGLHRLARQIIDDVEAVHSAGEDVRETWPDMWENYLHACAMLGHEAMNEPESDGPESHKL